MIIIIEGIDRVGKTTLANLISEKYNIPILKQSREGGNSSHLEEDAYITYGRIVGMVDYWNWCDTPPSLIMDRFHWTEAVYSYVERNNDFSINKMDYIDEKMAKNKDRYLIIYVRPSELQWSSKQHGKDLLKHNIEFDKLFSKSRLNKIDCFYEDFDNIVNKIAE